MLDTSQTITLTRTRQPLLTHDIQSRTATLRGWTNMWFSTLSHDESMVGAYALSDCVEIYEFPLPPASGDGVSEDREHPFAQAPAWWCGAMIRGVLAVASGERVKLARWGGYADPTPVADQAAWRPGHFDQGAFVDGGYEFVEVDRGQLSAGIEALDSSSEKTRLPEAIYFSSGLLFCIPRYGGAGYLSATYALGENIECFVDTPYSKVSPDQRAYTECFHWSGASQAEPTSQRLRSRRWWWAGRIWASRVWPWSKPVPTSDCTLDEGRS